MAYEKKTWRFAAGSLNLKPPGDEIPDNDAREIINLRSDDVGRLSARDGMFRVNGGDQTSPGDIHTLAKRYDTPGLYLGAGGKFWGFNGALLLESNFDGHPLGWANAGGFLYVMNRATQKRHNPARSPAWRDWGPPFIDAGGMAGAATGSGTLNGSYQLYITFENEDNEESAPSGPHTVTPDPVTDAAAISVFFVPTPANAQIKRRHIYLGGGTLGAGNIYRAHTVENNTDTEASFLTSEDAVTTQGDLLTIAIAATPAARGVTGPYYGRLVAYSSLANPNRFWWTPINLPWRWLSGAFNDVGAGDSPIFWVSQHKRSLVFYKPDSIWVLKGDASSGILEETHSTLGALGPRSIVKVGPWDYFGGSDGIYRFNLDTEQKISTRLDPIFQGKQTILADGVIIPPISLEPSVRERCVLAYAQGELWFSYPAAGQAWPSVTLVYNLQLNRWVRHRVATGVGSITGLRALFYDTHRNQLFGSLRDGYYYDLKSGSQDHSSDIQIGYLSAYLNMGLPDNDKWFEDLTIEVDTGGDAVNFRLYFNDGDSFEDLGNLNTTKLTRQTLKITQSTDEEGIRARNVALQFTGNIGTRFNLEEATLHYRVEPREALTFDSGVIDLGSELVKEISEIRFEMEPQATVTWRVFADLVTGAMSEKDTDTVPTGTRVKTFLLSQVIEGHRLQLTATSGSPFRAHSISLRVRLLGEYINGFAGDVWETPPLDLVA